jgi:uncharacterized membrane protein YphA (DoxX/SURF4 family)
MRSIRIRVVAAWALSILLFLTYLTVAPPKLMGDPGWLQRFQEWGYSARFAGGIGMAELVAAALLLVPSLATYGAGVLTLILAGAIYTHVSTGLHSPTFALQLFFMTAALAALRYPDARGVRTETVDTDSATAASD